MFQGPSVLILRNPWGKFSLTFAPSNYFFPSHFVVCLFVCLVQERGRGMHYSVWSMWRSEVALWESVLSFHHVESGDPIQVVILVTKCLHPLPSLVSLSFRAAQDKATFFASVFCFTDIFVVSVIVNHLRSSLTKYLVWAWFVLGAQCQTEAS